MHQSRSCQLFLFSRVRRKVGDFLQDSLQVLHAIGGSDGIHPRLLLQTLARDRPFRRGLQKGALLTQPANTFAFSRFRRFAILRGSERVTFFGCFPAAVSNVLRVLLLVTGWLLRVLQSPCVSIRTCEKAARLLTSPILSARLDCRDRQSTGWPASLPAEAPAQRPVPPTRSIGKRFSGASAAETQVSALIQSTNKFKAPRSVCT